VYLFVNSRGHAREDTCEIDTDVNIDDGLDRVQHFKSKLQDKLEVAAKKSCLRVTSNKSATKPFSAFPCNDHEDKRGQISTQ